MLTWCYMTRKHIENGTTIKRKGKWIVQYIWFLIFKKMIRIGSPCFVILWAFTSLTFDESQSQVSRVPRGIPVDGKNDGNMIQSTPSKHFWSHFNLLTLMLFHSVPLIFALSSSMPRHNGQRTTWVHIFKPLTCQSMSKYSMYISHCSFTWHTSEILGMILVHVFHDLHAWVYIRPTIETAVDFKASCQGEKTPTLWMYPSTTQDWGFKVWRLSCAVSSHCHKMVISADTCVMEANGLKKLN